MQHVWLDFCKDCDIDILTSVSDIKVLEKWWKWVIKNYTEPLPQITKSPWEVD